MNELAKLIIRAIVTRLDLHSNSLAERLRHMSQQIDTLAAKVEKMSSAVDSTKVVLATLSADLKDAIAHAVGNAGDLSKLEELSSKLDAKADELTAAALANTPADPNAPAPAPTPAT